METRTVAVSSAGADGLTAVIQAQVAACLDRGDPVVRVQWTSPLATITYTEGKPTAQAVIRRLVPYPQVRTTRDRTAGSVLLHLRIMRLCPQTPRLDAPHGR